MKFTLFVLIASFISVNSSPLVNLTKDQILKLTPRSLPFINQKIVTSLKKIYESISILNRISSGRKPCIWKICSKPVRKYQKKNEENRKMTSSKEICRIGIICRIGKLEAYGIIRFTLKNFKNIIFKKKKFK